LGNRWADDGETCKEDKEFDNKYIKKFKVKERTREAAVESKVKCSRCLKEFKTFNPSSYWICPKCAKS
jgi:ribosomal protein L37AE/L43A